MRKPTPAELSLIIWMGGLVIAGCGDPASTPGGGAQDTTAPQVVSVVPKEGGSVPPDTLLKVIFSEPVNLETAAFTLASGIDPIPLSVECLTGCTEVALTPQKALTAGVHYQAEVKKATDLAGNPIPTPVRWSFITLDDHSPTDQTPPRLESVFPPLHATDVALGISVTVRFSEPIDFTSIDESTFGLSREGARMAGAYTCGSTCSEVIFTPAQSLQPEAVYQIDVTGGIADPGGNRLLQSYSGSFKTAPLPAAVKTWTKQKGNNFNQTLYGVDAVSPDAAWAVGERGVILQTIDGGARWTLADSGASPHLYGVDFVTAQTGFAVGGEEAGAASFTNIIVKTSDGGKTWRSRHISGLPGVLKAVRFANDQKGWAVGGRGTILTTSDGGETWTAQQSGTTSDLTSVDFVNGDAGWAVGGTRLLKTVDGGATWGTVFTFPSPVRAIDFIDLQKGWAAGEGGAIFSTANGGQSWNAVQPTAAGLFGLQMSSEARGWAAGERGTLLSFNGTEWTLRPSENRIPLLAVAALSATSALAVGNYGIIVTAPEGGSAAVLNETVTSELFGPFFVDSMTGWTVGSDARIFRTTDGGKTWTPQIKNWRTDIAWTTIDSPRLCAGTPVSEETMTWTEDPVVRDAAGAPIPGRKYQCIRTTKLHLFSLFFLDRNKGWAVGLPSLILYTEDGGTTWTEQHIDPFAEDCYQCAKAGVYLRRVNFHRNGLDGWAIGRFRTIFKTTNGGKSWTEPPNTWRFPTPDGTCTTPGGTTLTRMGGHLFGLSVHPDNPKEVWVAGGCCKPCMPEALIAHTTDGGATWDIRTSEPGETAERRLPDIGRFHTIQVLGDVGWAAGRGGVVMRTTDRGATWKQVNLGTKETFNDLFFIDPTNGWLVGFFGALFKTVDGGAVWKNLSSGTRNDLFGVQFMENQQGWIAGSGDLILATKTGG